MKEVKIEVEIDRDGKITADADGFTGNACVRDLEKLLAGLGVAQEHVERKPDAGDVRFVRRHVQKTGRKGR